MKIITISQVGYNHPSQANWNWGIYKVDLINTDTSYALSHTVKEQFGGDSRFIQAIEKLQPEEVNTEYKVIRTKDIYTKTGTPKITGISNLLYMDDGEAGAELIREVKDFLLLV